MREGHNPKSLSAAMLTSAAVLALLAGALGLVYILTIPGRRAKTLPPGESAFGVLAATSPSLSVIRPSNIASHWEYSPNSPQKNLHPVLEMGETVRRHIFVEGRFRDHRGDLQEALGQRNHG